jgi:hypothetical protein
MGGMFTTVKVREGLARGDYKDPGWYAHPKGTLAAEWTGELPPAASAPREHEAPADGAPLKVRKPRGHGH